MSQTETTTVISMLVTSANKALNIVETFFDSITGIWPILLSLVFVFFLTKFVILPIIGSDVGSDGVTGLYIHEANRSLSNLRRRTDKAKNKAGQGFRIKKFSKPTATASKSSDTKK